jgi:hypothetical protein
METTVQISLGILVAVGIVVGYNRVTLIKTVRDFVDKPVRRQCESVQNLLAEHRLLVDRQAMTLALINHAVIKLNNIIKQLEEQEGEKP